MINEEVQDIVADGPIEIVTKDKPAAKTVHLFSLDGTEYWVREKVPFAVSMEATKIMAQRGEIAAQAYMAVAVLGQEAWDALIDADVDDEIFAKVVKYAELVVAGPGKGSATANNRAERRSGGKRSR